MLDTFGGVAGGAIGEFPVSDAAGGAPSPLVLLREPDCAVILRQEMRAVGSPQRYRMYVSDRVWKSTSTDSLPFMTLGGEITDGPVIEGVFSFGRGAENNGEQSGSTSLIIHRDGVPVETVGVGVAKMGLTRVRRDMQPGGWPTTILIGKPGLGLDSFVPVWQGVGDAFATTDEVTKVKLTFADSRAAYAKGLLASFAGTGDAEGTADNAGQLKPRHLGAPKNVEPVLIDTTDLIYFCSDRAAAAPLPMAYDGAAELTRDAAAIASYAALKAYAVASGSWVQARIPGLGTFVKLGAKPLKRLTVDFGDPLTVPRIIRTLLEEAGVESTAIVIPTETYPFGSGTDRSEDWQATQSMLQNDANGYLYIASQMTLNDAVNALCKGIGWSRFPDALGRMRFEAPDYALHSAAVAGTDYVVLAAGKATTVTNPDGTRFSTITGGDLLALKELALPTTMEPVNGRERLRANANATVLTEADVLAGATDARRQYVLKAGDDVVVESPADIFAAVKTAVDPDFLDTHITDSAYLPALGRWLLKTSALSDGRGAPTLRLTKRRMFQFTVPMALSLKLPALTTVKFDVPAYYPDEDLAIVGQIAPVKMDLRARTVDYYVYLQSQQYFSLFVGTVYGPDPGQSLYRPITVATNGTHIFVGVYAVSGPAVISASDLSWVGYAPIPPTLGFGNPSNYVADGDHLYMIDRQWTFLCLNVANPLSAVVEYHDSIADRIEALPNLTQLKLAAPIAVVASSGWSDGTGGGIFLYDVSNPSAIPFRSALLELASGVPLAVNAVAAHDQILYAATTDRSTIAIIDITEPAAPAVLGEVTGPVPNSSLYNISDMVAHGGYLYAVSQGKWAVTILKITGASLAWVGEFPLASPAYRIAANKSYLYLGNSGEGVTVLELGDPERPKLVTVITSPDHSLSQSYGMDVTDNGVVAVNYSGNCLSVIA